MGGVQCYVRSLINVPCVAEERHILFSHVVLRGACAWQELWVEPKHHMGEETAAIDVKDLLLAAPVKAPTLEQLTSEASGHVSQAPVLPSLLLCVYAKVPWLLQWVCLSFCVCSCGRAVSCLGTAVASGPRGRPHQ